MTVGTDTILIYSLLFTSLFHQTSEIVKTFLDIYFSIILWKRCKGFHTLVIASHFRNVDAGS